MVIGVQNLEWLNHNSQRAYPLTADATRTSIDGDFTIPNDFIVSLYLPVHWGHNIDSSKFHISQVSNFPTGFSITIGYESTTITEEGETIVSTVSVASTLVSKTAHTENQVYNLSGIGDFADSKGHVVIGDIANLNNESAGNFTFNLAGGRLEPDVIRPSIRGVMSLQAQNGSQLSSELYGHVRLKAGSNFRITPIVEKDQDPVLVLSAIDGTGLNEDCECFDENPPAIRTINGIPPDDSGNFTFLGSSCLEINGRENGLEFKDVCSEPCCGCEELEVVTQALEEFGAKATTLENFLVSLEARVTQMDQVVLGSRIGDRGCDLDCD
jgi:hypothetical protein